RLCSSDLRLTPLVSERSIWDDKSGNKASFSCSYSILASFNRKEALIKSLLFKKTLLINLDSCLSSKTLNLERITNSGFFFTVVDTLSAKLKMVLLFCVGLTCEHPQIINTDKIKAFIFIV